MIRMTTHRLIQVHGLEDTLSASARVSGRAAMNAARIGNFKAAAPFLRKAQRLNRIAERCRARPSADMAIAEAA